MNAKRFSIILLIGLIISIGLIAFNIFSKISHVGIKSSEKSPILTSDSNGEYWYRTWGGIFDDYGGDMILDSSNGIYITGNTRSYGAGEIDMCLVKYDNSGDLEWYRTWGGGGNEGGQGIILDSSENIYITGSTDSFGAGGSDIFLIKYNKWGNFEWYTTWGESNEEYGCDIAIDSSGDVYVVGYNLENICLIKFNNLGVQKWNRTWDSFGRDYASEIAIDSSDNIYIIGGTLGVMWLIKYNSSGDFEWDHLWGGIDLGKTIVIDSSDTIYVAGTDTIDVTTTEIVLAKYEQSTRQWSYTLKSESIFNIGDIAIALDSLENIYLATHAITYGDTYNNQMFLAKYNNNSGTFGWELQWGASGSEMCSAISLDPSDNIYLAGSTSSYGAGESDLCLIKNPIDTSIKPINPLILFLSFGGSYLLFTIGMVFLYKKRRQISGIILKKYKRALISGWFLFGIGIALISWGVFIWDTARSYSFDRIGAIGLWVISGIILLFGVWYLVDSIRIKKSMKKLEKSERDIR